MDLLAPRQWLNYAKRGRVRILMYHSVADNSDDRLTISARLFEQEMQYLAERRFEIVSLRAACALMRANADLRRKVALTFDDGYLDFLTTAAPILKRHGFTATLFVVTGTPNGGAQASGWRPPVPFLTIDQIRQVKAMGFSLGSHTVTHRDLTKCDAGSLMRELSESRSSIEAWGETFLAFAYPGGRFTRRERDAVEQEGYDCAAIVGGRWGNGADTDRFLLKREPMLASDTYEWFKKRVNGYFEPNYVWARARGIQTR